jgi:glutathione S-transferase
VTLGVNSVALKVTICCTAVLYMKMLCTLLIQGGKRIIAGSRPEEDQALLPDFGTQSLLDAPVAAEDTEKREAKEIEARWIRLVSNDTENIPMGLIAAWGSLFCAYSQPWHVGLLLAFTVARVGHTFAYANAKQPHRVFAYMVGVLATLGMCANGVAGALLA